MAPVTEVAALGVAVTLVRIAVLVVVAALVEAATVWVWGQQCW